MALDGIVSWLRPPARFKRVALSKIGNEATGQIYFEPMDAVPTVATVEGRVAWDTAANGLAQCDGTVYRHLSDRYIIKVLINANSVDQDCFIADRAYKVKAFKGTKSTAGGSGAAVGLKKCTGTTAPGSGTAVTSADLDLTTGVAVNTVMTGTLTATAADLLLAAGDRLALDFSGTLTNLVGLVEVVLEQV